MKNIITLFLMSFLNIVAFGQTPTNGVYIQNGITTEIGEQIYPVSTINRSPILYFSNGLLTKPDTNADFLINSFFQDVLNTNLHPEKAKFGASTLNITLTEGSAYFVYPENDTNSSCVVSTPFADIELHKGAFYIVVNTNNALCLVIDGSMVAYGEKKEQKKVESGSALVCIPNTQGIFETKFSLSTQFIKEPVLNRYKSTIKDIAELPKSVIFIRINGKTIAVTL